ncbi:vanadium-dependent haloperoxidase [Mucilaginibacter ginsenosidivorans]|nr:vanadium-dependent haloperoxidase [Mucilaginibacter ginsenosidivorans]
MKRLNLILAAAFVLLLSSCTRKSTLPPDADVLHANEDALTQVIIYDVFTPPVASRIYGYTNLASYEAMRYADPKLASITAQLRDFEKMPEPQKGKSYNYVLAATKAFFTVAHKVTFSIDTLKRYEDKVYGEYKDALPDSTYTNSMQLGEQIGNTVLKRAMKDDYPQTRGKPKYLGSNSPGKWRPTPPDYMDGVEYCWGDMHPLLVESSKILMPPPPPPYSEDTTSAFFKQAKQVYDTNKHLTKEQETIARYWDDNPFVVMHNGHMMFADKKITPGGHWIGITTIACRQSKASATKTAQAYALTSIALFESFITCWEVKYTYAYVRPVTVINEKVDHNWLPLLQTPPFPEYTAGHSTISAASAVVLTHEFGDNYAFHDTSDLKYIGLQRDFKSFIKASDETAMSRFYGGIHYLNSSLLGAKQGKQVGELIWQKLKLNN